jgi:hypothetical protein
VDVMRGRAYGLMFRSRVVPQKSKRHSDQSTLMIFRPL